LSAQGNRRPSWEILEDLCQTVPPKEIAYRMGLNLSLIYEWKKEPESPEEMMNTGKRNPLDRNRELINLAVTHGRKDIAIEMFNWLAADMAGVFAGDDQITALEAIIEAIKQQSTPPPAKVALKVAKRTAAR
jgi:hypothetical protein